MFDLSGNIALITGASGGSGRPSHVPFMPVVPPSFFTEPAPSGWPSLPVNLVTGLMW